MQVHDDGQPVAEAVDDLLHVRKRARVPYLHGRGVPLVVRPLCGQLLFARDGALFHLIVLLLEKLEHAHGSVRAREPLRRLHCLRGFSIIVSQILFLHKQRRACFAFAGAFGAREHPVCALMRGNGARRRASCPGGSCCCRLRRTAASRRSCPWRGTRTAGRPS